MRPHSTTCRPVAPALARKQDASWSVPVPHLPNFATAAFYQPSFVRCELLRVGSVMAGDLRIHTQDA